MELLAQNRRFTIRHPASGGRHGRTSKPMKLTHSPKPTEAGNALLVTMLTTGIIIAALGCYLSLASQENKTVMRSMCWNNALPMAEAGIDEAMSHLGVNTNGYAVDGWSTDGTNFSKQRFLGSD